MEPNKFGEKKITIDVQIHLKIPINIQ
jgi:hypothetical protein